MFNFNLRNMVKQHKQTKSFVTMSGYEYKTNLLLDDLLKKVRAKNKPVNSIISKKGFLDIGNKTSYKKANQEHLQKLGNT